MENQEQKQPSTPQTDSPKPTDDVQLTVETVTPDTEKEVVPTPVHEGKAETKAADAATSESTEPSNESSEEESAANATDTAKSTKDDEGDERDQVETVAP
jgi:hypothetical protein